MLQYWAKVMKTIVDEYRENRDISANFKEISFGTKYRATVVGEISPSRVRYFATTQRNIVYTQW